MAANKNKLQPVDKICEECNDSNMIQMKIRHIESEPKITNRAGTPKLWFRCRLCVVRARRAS